MNYEQHDRYMSLVYDKRVPWYPDDPDRLESEEQNLVDVMREDFKDRSVLEIGCGGGHWARRLLPSARRIVGIDISENRVQFARERGASLTNVEFLQGDAYSLDDVPGDFDAAYAVAWFSHVPQARYEEFLTGLHRRIGGSGGIVYLIDETENDENAFMIEREPDYYKRSGLPGGETCEIVDNCFTTKDYDEIFSPYGRDIRNRIGPIISWVRYEVI